MQYTSDRIEFQLSVLATARYFTVYSVQNHCCLNTMLHLKLYARYIPKMFDGEKNQGMPSVYF